MNNVLLGIALPIVMKVIEELLKPENIQKYGDKFFDFVEDAVESSSTTIDDKTVLPIVRALRVGMNIPDND